MSARNPVPREGSYEGVRATNPPNVIISKRAPIAADFRYPIGTIWVNTVAPNAYMMTQINGTWQQLT